MWQHNLKAERKRWRQRGRKAEEGTSNSALLAVWGAAWCIRLSQLQKWLEWTLESTQSNLILEGRLWLVFQVSYGLFTLLLKLFKDRGFAAFVSNTCVTPCMQNHVHPLKAPVTYLMAFAPCFTTCHTEKSSSLHSLSLFKAIADCYQICFSSSSPHKSYTIRLCHLAWLLHDLLFFNILLGPGNPKQNKISQILTH